MVVGVVVAVVGVLRVPRHRRQRAAPQNDAQMIGMIGIALTIAGGAVFLRYSIAGSCASGSARLIVEQQREGRD